MFGNAKRVQPGSDFRQYNFTPAKSKHVSKDPGEESVLTVVNTSKNGKRVTFAPRLLEGIGSPDAVQIMLGEEGIAIGSKLIEGGEEYKLRKAGKKGVVYSAGLVEEITEYLGLDFSARSSISFRDLFFLKDGDRQVAFVPVSGQAGQEDPEGEQQDQTEEDDEVEA
jgi:hypothetical protein